MTRIGISSYENHRREGTDGKHDVRYEYRIDFPVRKQTVREEKKMDGRENESVGTENLKRHFVFRSKRGIRSCGQYGKADSEPTVKNARFHAEGCRRRIRDAVERKVKKEESEVVRSRF